jgi:hypothetical protein
MIYNINGNAIDSISNFSVSAPCWQNDSTIIFPDNIGIGGININTKSSFYYYEFKNNNESALSCFWSADNYEIYFNTTVNALYKYNVQTKQITCLKQKCENDLYHSISISPTNLLLMVVDHQKYIGNGTVGISGKVVTMGSDGSGESTIIAD